MKNTQWWELNTVGKRFLIPTITLLVILLVIFGATLVLRNADTAEETLRTRAASISHFMQRMAEGYVEPTDPPALDNLVQKAVKDPDITYIAFYNPKNALLSRSSKDLSRPSDSDNNFLRFDHALRNRDGAIVGRMEMFFSIASIGDNIASGVMLVLVGIAIILGIFVVGIVVLTQGITVPLARVLTTVEKVAAGDLTAEADVARADEVGNLGRQINLMIHSLRKLIGQIKTSAEQINSVVGEITSTAAVIIRGTETQAYAADETGSSMEQMSINIQSVNRNAEALAASVAQTTDSIQQLGVTARGVAENADVMAGNVSDTSSTIEQMLITINTIAKNVSQAEKLARQATDEAKTGGDAVLQTVHGMRRIGTMMTNISGVIETLGIRSEAIGGIVEVIEEIADQTNLLALNAAIEAARAGKAGRGFAVVADEVRKLAERSIKATKEIGEVISQVQKETTAAVDAAEDGAASSHDGIVLADTAGSAINSIMSSVGSVSSIMAEVAEASTAQAQAADNVIEGIEQMNKLTKAVTNSARDQAMSIDQVIQASQDMARATEEVKDATAEQKKGGEIVVKAIENINEIGRSNQSAVEQLSRVASSLAGQSESLQKMVQVFITE